MPTHAGPNILGEENLVFAYDTGDVGNSYKGEPTVNQYTNPDFTNGTTGWSFASWDGNVTYTTEVVTGPFGKTINALKLTKNATSAYSHFHQYNSGKYTTGNQYTLSAWVKGVGTFRGNTQWSGTEQSFILTGDWQYVKYTVTAPNDSNFPYWAAEALTTGTVFYMAYAQSEQKSHATPFIIGTRSTTQGLLPLIGNSTIDLTNVSFDSNAQIVFDGTDDTISVPSYSAIELVDNVSIEYVYMRLSTDSILDIIANKYHNTGWELFCTTASTFALAGRNGDGTYYSTSNAAYTIQNNTYYHLVAIKEGLSWRLYVNGEIYASLTANSIGTWSNTGILQIGGEGAGYFPNMKLPVLKIYNRVLTASEISRNFNAIQAKFNILGVGNNATNSGISAKTIKQLNSGASNGYYWIKPPQLTNPIQAYCDMTTDGGGWTKFWWYNGKGWPSGLHALDYSFGTHNQGGDYGFQRLPQYLTKSNTELLAKDGAGNVYKWDFANASETSQRVWNSFFSGTEGAWANVGTFNPTVIAGSFNAAAQDTWQYRLSEGIKSFLLDDDTCDCESSLNAGHAMCGTTGWTQDYAQPVNAYLRYGVDVLNGFGCNGPLPINSLELYFREKN